MCKTPKAPKAPPPVQAAQAPDLNAVLNSRKRKGKYTNSTLLTGPSGVDLAGQAPTAQATLLGS